MRHGMKRGARKVVMLVLFAGIATGFCFSVRELWNWLMPVIFGLPHIGFWQALGLLALTRILFGGLRGWPGHRGRWGNRMRERWNEMSPEEREKFRRGLQGRCGGGPPEARPGVAAV